MLAFIGDIHGEADALEAVVRQIEQYSDITAIIQVGDFGFYPSRLPLFENINPKIPIYAIDGNHEDFSLFVGLTTPTEVGKNIFYVPRGTVLELDGRTVAFMGGAASVDKDFRIQMGRHWDGRENISDIDISKWNKNTKDKKIDIMVTHCPPQSVIQKHFDPRGLAFFGLPTTWRDANADIVEKLWSHAGYPTLFCGHMHRSVVEGTARILNINELFCL